MPVGYENGRIHESGQLRNCHPGKERALALWQGPSLVQSAAVEQTLHLVVSLLCCSPLGFS